MQNEKDRQHDRQERPVDRPERPTPPPDKPSRSEKRIDYGEKEPGVISPDNWVNPWDKETNDER